MAKRMQQIEDRYIELQIRLEDATKRFSTGFDRIEAQNDKTTQVLDAMRLEKKHCKDSVDSRFDGGIRFSGELKRNPKKGNEEKLTQIDRERIDREEMVRRGGQGLLGCGPALSSRSSPSLTFPAPLPPQPADSLTTMAAPTPSQRPWERTPGPKLSSVPLLTAAMSSARPAVGDAWTT